MSGEMGKKRKKSGKKSLKNAIYHKCLEEKNKNKKGTTHVRADPWCLEATPTALAEMASG